MRNKLKIIEVLGSVGQCAKGFIRQYLVGDITGSKSVVKVFSKELSGLPDSGEIIVDCNDFCFVSKP